MKENSDQFNRSNVAISLTTNLPGRLFRKEKRWHIQFGCISSLVAPERAPVPTAGCYFDEPTKCCANPRASAIFFLGS